MIRTPVIVLQTPQRLLLKAPSKSRPNSVNLVEYQQANDRECSCEGHYWFKQRGQAPKKMCRHHRMTTIFESETPFDDLKYAMKVLRTKANKLSLTLAFIRCQYPDHRNSEGILCASCPLYPATCNIHPIKTGRNKPLVWKLQTALYNGRRGDARKILRQIVLNVRRSKK